MYLLNTTKFIQKAIAAHGDKYDYSKSNYLSARDKIEIVCPTHGSFWQIASNHINQKNGCGKCFNLRRSNSRRLNLSTVVERFKQSHGDTYDYSKVEFITTEHKVEIVCEYHGSFLQRVSDHFRGHGCLKCADHCFVSRVGTEWLDSIGISHEYRELSLKEFPNRPVDALVTDTNTVYQFHGDYWHGNPVFYKPTLLNAHSGKTMGELFEATQQWDQTIRDLGYNLVVMWESDWREHLRNNKVPNKTNSVNNNQEYRVRQ